MHNNRIFSSVLIRNNELFRRVFRLRRIGTGEQAVDVTVSLSKTSTIEWKLIYGDRIARFHEVTPTPDQARNPDVDRFGFN